MKKKSEHSDLFTISISSAIGWIAFLFLGSPMAFIAFFLVFVILYGLTYRTEKITLKYLRNNYGYRLSDTSAERLSLNLIYANTLLVGIAYGWVVETTIGQRLWS